MDQAITRALPCATSPATAAPRALGEFKGYIDGEPAVRWFDRKNMPQVGDKLFAAPARAAGAEPRSWSILLTSANHGTVGPLGSTFPHAGEHHERVQVVEIVEAGTPPVPGVDLAGLVRIGIEGTVIPRAAPSAPVGAVPSVDTREFRELLAKAMDAAELATHTGEPHRDYKPARDQLIAHIDQHVASQVRAARNAALEEAAALTIKRTAVPRDVLGPATSQMKSLAAAGEQLADKIAALKDRPAISHSGEGAPDDAELKQVVGFLMGESALEGVNFGERHPTRAGAFWWRLNLRAAMHKAAEAQQK